MTPMAARSAPARPWRHAPPAPASTPPATKVIYIANPAFGTRGLYVTVVRALGATPRFFKAEVMAQAQELLEAEESERHRRVVIVVDEAHLLQPDQLERATASSGLHQDSRHAMNPVSPGGPEAGS